MMVAELRGTARRSRFAQSRLVAREDREGAVQQRDDSCDEEEVERRESHERAIARDRAVPAPRRVRHRRRARNADTDEQHRPVDEEGDRVEQEQRGERLWLGHRDDQAADQTAEPEAHVRDDPLLGERQVADLRRRAERGRTQSTRTPDRQPSFRQRPGGRPGFQR
jgi:hypothetical protein